jgi:hypothetical protein
MGILRLAGRSDYRPFVCGRKVLRTAESVPCKLQIRLVRLAGWYLLVRSGMGAL